MKRHANVFFAGQICGVEGYTESIAAGLLAGVHAAALACRESPHPPPRGTALGSLIHYICKTESKNFQPANITFDLLPPLTEETRRLIRDKRERHRIQCQRALDAFESWWSELPTQVVAH
jgi:methylenetetrahydrofolate--tRNA-(uracil-5-)-methyltransferase